MAPGTNIGNIGNGGVTATPLVGTLFQSVTGTSATDACNQLAVACVPAAAGKQQANHVYLSSADNSV